MKKRFTCTGVLFLALSLGFSLTACNSDENHGSFTDKHGAGGPMTTAEGKRIKSIQTMDETITFTYDAQGRIVKMTEQDRDDAEVDVTTYEYHGNSIIACEYGDDNKIDDKVEYTVTNGLIVKSVEKNSISPDKETFRYHENRLVEYVQDRDESSTYTWTAGNITGLTERDEKETDITSYTYSNTVSNSKLELMLIVDCDPVLILQGYMGVGTANQLGSITEGPQSVQCSYTLDANGNVSAIQLLRNGNAVRTMTVTWE